MIDDLNGHRWFSWDSNPRFCSYCGIAQDDRKASGPCVVNSINERRVIDSEVNALEEEWLP